MYVYIYICLHIYDTLNVEASAHNLLRPGVLSAYAPA